MQIYWNKKSVYIRKEFNPHMIGLEHQYGCCDVMWKHLLDKESYKGIGNVTWCFIFVLITVINAENAAHKSEKFSAMATRTRHEYLKDLATNYVTSTTLETGAKGKGKNINTGV